MIITYFGCQFFKIQQGEMVFAINPISKQSKISKTGMGAHFGADIALVTTNHPDYNGIEQLSHGDRTPFVINGPGDYETKDIFIKGVSSDSVIASKKYINTIYLFSLDGINIAFLGALSNPEFSKETREAINSPDILFVPIGGLPLNADKGKEAGLLDAKMAAKIALSLEPKLIIPMDYDDNTLKIFLKEIGEEKAEAIVKLTLKKKDLDGKEGEVIILQTT